LGDIARGSSGTFSAVKRRSGLNLPRGSPSRQRIHLGGIVHDRKMGNGVDHRRPLNPGVVTLVGKA